MEIIFSAMVVFLQYSSLAAQYSSPGQQNHPTLGQHPPGHSVPGQSCLISLLTFTGAAMEIKILAKLVFLQYSSLAAQYSSPGQQYHPTFGQHPPGHSVPGQSCLTIFLGAAMEINFSAMLVFLQYSSLAAQYSSPGQQNHPTLGQQPPGQTVPGQSCLTSLIGGQSASVAAQKNPLSQQI